MNPETMVQLLQDQLQELTNQLAFAESEMRKATIEAKKWERACHESEKERADANEELWRANMRVVDLERELKEVTESRDRRYEANIRLNKKIFDLDQVAIENEKQLAFAEVEAKNWRDCYDMLEQERDTTLDLDSYIRNASRGELREALTKILDTLIEDY